jgi:hypothetical protein
MRHLLLSILLAAASASADTELWFDKPAER